MVFWIKWLIYWSMQYARKIWRCAELFRMPKQYESNAGNTSLRSRLVGAARFVVEKTDCLTLNLMKNLKSFWKLSRSVSEEVWSANQLISNYPSCISVKTMTMGLEVHRVIAITPYLTAKSESDLVSWVCIQFQVLSIKSLLSMVKYCDERWCQLFAWETTTGRAMTQV